jgi:hypothetical protein
MDILSDIEQFVSLLMNDSVDIYNEFSLQHELGIYLRSRNPGRNIQFERNISFFGIDKLYMEKREIDISIFSPDMNELDAVIELKYPRNGQVPEQMFSFCKDISFIEQLTERKFRKGYFLALADDPLFYSGSCEKIYSYFRGGKILTGTIQKPTGARDKRVTVRGEYSVEWKPIRNQQKYCLLEVSR